MTELEKATAAAHAALDDWSEERMTALRNADTPRERWAAIAKRGRELLEHAEKLAALELAELKRHAPGGPGAP